jgi:vacuolar-type H+-ATPase subunit I/STV1
MERESEHAEHMAQVIREGIREEEQRIGEERQTVQQQQDEIRQERQEIAQARQQPDADQNALDQREQAVQRQEEEVRTAEEELSQRQEAVEERRQEAESQLAFAQQRGADAQAQRQQIAEDMQVMIVAETPPPPVEGILAVSILNSGNSQGRLVKLDPNTGMEVLRSPLTSVNTRTVTLMNNRIIAIAGESRGSSAIRLVELSSNNLEMLRQGENDISPDSLIWPNGQNLYAIISTNNGLFLARFNSDLLMQASSSVSVHPFASVLFSGNYIITQRSDGSPLMLNQSDLRAIR